jgi:hypothetical protein
MDDKSELKKLLETLFQYKECEITITIDSSKTIQYDNDSLCFQYTNIENGITQSYKDISSVLEAIKKESLITCT